MRQQRTARAHRQCAADPQKIRGRPETKVKATRCEKVRTFRQKSKIPVLNQKRVVGWRLRDPLRDRVASDRSRCTPSWWTPHPTPQQSQAHGTLHREHTRKVPHGSRTLSVSAHLAPQLTHTHPRVGLQSNVHTYSIERLTESCTRQQMMLSNSVRYISSATSSADSSVCEFSLRGC